MIRTPKQGNHGDHQAVVFVEPGHFKVFQATKRQALKQAAAWKAEGLDAWIELASIESAVLKLFQSYPPGGEFAA